VRYLLKTALPNHTDPERVAAEMAKMKYYREQAEDLFKIILETGDWYDYSNNGSIATDEKSPNRQNLVRVR
jgi:hypothetical protein